MRQDYYYYFMEEKINCISDNKVKIIQLESDSNHKEFKQN